MKQRPRRAENRIAEILNQFFTHNNLTPIDRIPVLGRTGPDLTINETGLAIDVKSRKSCPKKIFASTHKSGKAMGDSYCAFSLEHLQDALAQGQGQYMTFTESKTVLKWLVHMEKWVKQNAPSGIPALVIHRPQMPYGKALLIVSKSDVGLLRQRITGESSIHLANGTVIKFRKTDDKLRGAGEIYMTPEDLSAITQWIRRQENE